MWNGIRPNGLAFLLGKVIPRFNVHVSMRERRLKTAWNAKILLKRHRIFHPCLVNYCMPLGREPWYLDDPRCAFYFVQKSLKTSQHVPAIFTKVGKLVWTCPKLNARTWVLDSFSLGSEVPSLVLTSSNRTRISPAPKTQETDSIEGFVSTSSGSSASISSQWSPNILRHRKTKKSSDGKKGMSGHKMQIYTYNDNTENSAFESFESRSSFSVTWICFFFWSSARNKMFKATWVPSMAKVEGSWAVSFIPAAVSWIQPRIVAKESKSEKRWWKDVFSRKIVSHLSLLGGCVDLLFELHCLPISEKIHEDAAKRIQERNSSWNTSDQLTNTLVWTRWKSVPPNLLGTRCKGSICCWRDVFRPIDLIQDRLLVDLQFCLNRDLCLVRLVSFRQCDSQNSQTRITNIHKNPKKMTRDPKAERKPKKWTRVLTWFGIENCLVGDDSILVFAKLSFPQLPSLSARDLQSEEHHGTCQKFRFAPASAKYSEIKANQVTGFR